MNLWRRSRQRRWDILAGASLLLVTIAGHGATVFGFAQPVGGDKTAFFYGLMTHYGQTLQQGAWPFWNEAWGLGFPSLAESQTGIFYPFHLLLWTLCPPLTAFRLNFVLHRLLTAVVSYAAFRGLGLRPLGAWVAVLSYLWGGFAVGHLDHQWAYESMLWLPPLVWATHAWIVQGKVAGLRALPLLLACQLFIGHYQIAFMTLVLAGGWALLGAPRRDRKAVPWKRLGGWLAAVVLGFMLAAPQVLPTFYLQDYIRTVNPAALSRDFLATHAFAPWLTGQLLLPYVYFREPLWREVIWTPFHTAPEECLAYIGLLPLGLALLSIGHVRRRRFVRVVSLLGLLALILSFGPWQPAFPWLSSLPGFGYFRSSARWLLAVHFCLGLLAGWMADRLRGPQKLWAAWLVGVALTLATLLGTVGWWCVFDRAIRTGDSLPAPVVALVSAARPTPHAKPAAAMLTALGTPRGWDGYIWKMWSQLERGDELRRLPDQWGETFRLEVLPTLAVVGVGTLMVLLPVFCHKPRRWLIGGVVVGICLGDFGLFRMLFPDTVAPVAALTPPGPVAQALTALPAASRIVGPGGNFLMAYGVAPVRGYRTLDVPWPRGVAETVERLEQKPALLQEPPPPLATLIDVTAVMQHPMAAPANRPPNVGPHAVLLADPQLDWWLEGNLWLRRLLHRRNLVAYTLLTTRPQVSEARPRAILLPQASVPPPTFYSLSRLSGEVVLDLRGLAWEPEMPVTGRIERLPLSNGSSQWQIHTDQPTWAIFGEMYAPGWTAVLQQQGSGKEERQVHVARVEGYWRALLLAAGDYRVRFAYSPPGLHAGLWLAGIAGLGWVGWVGSAFILVRRHFSVTLGQRETL